MYLGKPIYLLAHVVLVNDVFRTASAIDELGFGPGKTVWRVSAAPSQVRERVNVGVPGKAHIS